MFKSTGIPASLWLSAKADREREALIALHRAPLTPAEVAQREREEQEAQQSADAAERLSYQERRRAEYPAIGDQLDAIMKWLATEGEFSVPTELKSLAMKCMSVKAKYPKPTED